MLVDSDKHFTAQQVEGVKRAEKKTNYPLYVHLPITEFFKVSVVVCRMVSTSATQSDGSSAFLPLTGNFSIRDHYLRGH